MRQYQYKDWWQEKYSELSHQMFDCDYWELNQEQTKELNKAMENESAEYAANLADALKECLGRSQ